MLILYSLIITNSTLIILSINLDSLNDSYILSSFSSVTLIIHSLYFDYSLLGIYFLSTNYSSFASILFIFTNNLFGSLPSGFSFSLVLSIIFTILFILLFILLVILLVVYLCYKYFNAFKVVSD